MPCVAFGLCGLGLVGVKGDFHVTVGKGPPVACIAKRGPLEFHSFGWLGVSKKRGFGSPSHINYWQSLATGVY